jgi:hypothetical protein
MVVSNKRKSKVNEKVYLLLRLTYNINMQSQEVPSNLELNFTVPTVSQDGQATVLNNSIDGIAVINFFQFRPPKNDLPQADVVASVSFPNMVSFKKFVNDMQANLTQHEQHKK